MTESLKTLGYTDRILPDGKFQEHKSSIRWLLLLFLSIIKHCFCLCKSKEKKLSSLASVTGNWVPPATLFLFSYVGHA